MVLDQPVSIISRHQRSVPSFRETWFRRSLSGVLKPGARRGVARRWLERDSSVGGKFSRTIDRYRFNEAKWTKFRFT